MADFAAAVCTALDGPGAVEVLRVERTPLRPGDLRLRVAAAGVNFPDLLMTRGAYQLRPEPPFTPGMEVAGEVIEVGPESRAALGDQVCASTRLGGFAEEVTVPGSAIKPWPNGFSAPEAAAFYVAGLTAWHALVDRAVLKAGERLLVLGAGGGVGLAAVQLGRALGAEVVAAARSNARLDAAGRAGASSLVDLIAGPLRASVEAACGKRTVDVVLDPVGGSLAREAAGCLTWGGRYLIVGFASGEIPTLAFNQLLLAGYSVLGVRAGEHARRNPDAARTSLTALLALAGESDLKPVVGLQLPLSRVADALAALDRGEVVGKAVLVT